MRINIKLTDRQAYNLASKIYRANFRVFGIGHFDVSTSQFADILQIAFNEESEDKVLDYYDKIK